MSNYWLNHKYGRNKRVSRYEENILKYHIDPEVKEWIDRQVVTALPFLSTLDFFCKTGFAVPTTESRGSFLTALAVCGDIFFEKVCSHGDSRPLILQSLPPQTMYRIETIKGNLVEYQQSGNGPDYAALARVPIEKATRDELRWCNPWYG